MKLFIPPLGTRLKILEDWSFSLYPEIRNESLVKKVAAAKVAQAKKDADALWIKVYCDPSRGRPGGISLEDQRAVKLAQEIAEAPFPFTLPKDTVLIMDRIYIRQKMEKYDSVTFYIESSPDTRLVAGPKRGFIKGMIRFWTKLSDANNIECEILT